MPLALAELDRLYLMDEDGGLIDIYGPRTGGLRPADRARARSASRRSRGATGPAGRGRCSPTSPSSASEVSEVYVEPSGDLRVVLRGAGEVLLFGDPPYRQRLVTFLSLRRDLAETAPGAEHFDLRFRGRIFAKRPAPAAAPSEPGAAPSLPAAEHPTRPGPRGPARRPRPAAARRRRPIAVDAAPRRRRPLAARGDAPARRGPRGALAACPGQQ